jgi:hypothetical protein
MSDMSMLIDLKVSAEDATTADATNPLDVLPPRAGGFRHLMR